MQNVNTFTFYLFIFLLLSLVFVNKNSINNLENELDNYHIIQAECEEVITYKQFARHQLLCYMGENHNYSSNEQRVIEQWKNSNNN